VPLLKTKDIPASNRPNCEGWVNNEERAGHWGLPGMRERAKRIGGKMDLWSELGAGTEVELRIPASIAYQAYAGRRFRLFR